MYLRAVGRLKPTTHYPVSGKSFISQHKFFYYFMTRLLNISNYLWTGSFGFCYVLFIQMIVCGAYLIWVRENSHINA